MPIIKRKCREDGYAQINNEFLQREDLAYDTKGMLCELFSRPDNWVVYKTQLERSHTGSTRLTRMSKEAQKLGYMQIENLRDDKGHIIDRAWNVSTNPVEEWIETYRVAGLPKDRKPQAKETSSQGNQPLQRKSNTNTDKETNKEKDILIEKPSTVVDDITNHWNTLTKLPKITSMNASRLKKLKLRLKEDTFRDNWKDILDKLNTSAWHIGENDRGWVANFDWIITNDTNYVKILEAKKPAPAYDPDEGLLTADEAFTKYSQTPRGVNYGVKPGDPDWNNGEG